MLLLVLQLEPLQGQLLELLQVLQLEPLQVQLLELLLVQLLVLQIQLLELLQVRQLELLLVQLLAPQIQLLVPHLEVLLNQLVELLLGLLQVRPPEAPPLYHLQWHHLLPLQVVFLALHPHPLLEALLSYPRLHLYFIIIPNPIL